MPAHQSSKLVTGGAVSYGRTAISVPVYPLPFNDIVDRTTRREATTPPFCLS